MSWLRDHFHHFVFPAFEAAGKKTTEIGKPFDVKASPHAPENLPTELKKLWTLCQDHKVEWSYDIKEGNFYGGTSKYRESAKLHHKLLRTTLDSALIALRAEGCSRLFLGGRDVWTFAVLCERRRIPYMFVPELSRNVANSPASRPFLETLGFKGDELFLDTGFVGSIPRSLEKHFGRAFPFRLMSQSDQDFTTKNGFTRRPNQLFPNRKAARSEALETEYLAKYWKTGGVDRNEFVGHASTTWAKWQMHPGPIFRYTPEERHSYLYSGKSYGLTDGTHWEFIAHSDAESLASGFVAWWEALPWKPEDWKPEEKVHQFFSEKAIIQRAALLTVQLWRGIPFWRNVSNKVQKGEEGQMFKGGNTIYTSNSTALDPATMKAYYIAAKNAASSSTITTAVSSFTTDTTIVTSTGTL